MKRGVEANQEVEFKLTSGSKMMKFLKKMGIELPLKKIKKGEIYQKGDSQIELNQVSGLGYFLEIEVIAKKKSEVPQAKQKLIATFKEFGFTDKDFEKKYYLELLEEKRKNKNSN